MQNHLGSYECKLCLTLHTNEGSYLAHTQAKKHQENLKRRAFKEAKEAEALPAPLAAQVDKKKFVKIGNPGYKVTKQRDPETLQNSMLFQIDYPELTEGVLPKHRFMAAFEQKVEAPDRDWQYVVCPPPPPPRPPTDKTVTGYVSPQLACLERACVCLARHHSVFTVHFLASAPPHRSHLFLLFYLVSAVKTGTYSLQPSPITPSALKLAAVRLTLQEERCGPFSTKIPSPSFCNSISRLIALRKTHGNRRAGFNRLQTR
jgi:hypothetical protein